MASIHRVANSKFYRMAFKGPDGKQVVQSTKTTDPKLALELAVKMERAAAGLTQLPKADILLIIEKMVWLVQQAASGVINEGDVRAFLNDLLKLAGKPALDNHTIRQALEDWLESKKTKAKGTQIRYKDTIGGFLTFLSGRADSPLQSLRADDVEQFQQLQIKQGKAPATANEIVKVIRVALNYYRRKGIVQTNVAEAVDLLDGDSVGKQPFTRAQILRLLQASPSQDWTGMIIVGSCVGARIGDAARLKWENIDLEKGTLTYRQTKTKRSGTRAITTILLPDLRTHLESIRGSTSPFLFPSLCDLKSGGLGGLSGQFGRIMKDAGIENIPLRKGGQGKGRAFFAYGYHSFRHTVVSVLENLGVPEEIRKLHVGHTSAAHERYSHREVSSIRDSLKGFPSLHPQEGLGSD